MQTIDELFNEEEERLIREARAAIQAEDNLYRTNIDYRNKVDKMREEKLAMLSESVPLEEEEEDEE